MNVQSNNKKNIGSKILMIVLGLFFLLGAIMPFITNGAYMFGSRPTELNQVLFENDLENQKGKYVSVDVDAIIDIYAETTHSYNFIPVGKDNHYIIWLDDSSMISLAISGKENEINAIIDSTWEYLDEKAEYLTDKPLHVEGTIKSLSGDVRKFYDEAMEYFGINESGTIIRYYEIDATESRLLNWITSIVMLALALFFLYAAFAKPKNNNSNNLPNHLETIDNNQINDSISEIENNLDQ